MRQSLWRKLRTGLLGRFKRHFINSVEARKKGGFPPFLEAKKLGVEKEKCQHHILAVML
jgi:hypothetical protein